MSVAENVNDCILIIDMHTAISKIHNIIARMLSVHVHHYQGVDLHAQEQ